MIDDPERDGEIVVFDPVRITDGIELTADPVLNFRPARLLRVGEATGRLSVRPVPCESGR